MLAALTSLAFEDVAVIPKVGRLYALFIAQIADRFRPLLLECKRVPLSEHALHRHYGQLMAC